MSDDLGSLDLSERLFGNQPQPPAENRPGLNRRHDFRALFDQNEAEGVPPGTQKPLLSEVDIARADLMLRRLNALIQNSNITASLPAYGAPHLWSTPIDLSARFVLPAVVTPYTTVLRFAVPPGRWARIDGYGVDVDGAFTYDNSILWRIRKNGIDVPYLADWGQHRGSVIEPRDTFILGNGDIGSSNGMGEVITFEVQRAIAAGAPSNVDMVLTGWTWRPRNNYEGTRSGMTAF